MASAQRLPEHCAHRRALPEDPQGFSCALVARVLGSQSSASAGVEHDACEACCKFNLPDAKRLNPVIAALVCRAADPTRQPLATQSVSQQLADLQARTFAAQFLAIGNPLPEEIQAGSPPIPSRLQPLLAASGSRSDSLSLPRLGLVGAQHGFGLAHQNQDIANYLSIDRWLTPTQVSAPVEGTLAARPAYRLDRIARPMSHPELEAWLDGLDAVIFVEHPTYPNLTRVAQQLGVCVICVPNWEWLHPALAWLPDVDLMLCPTRHTHQMLTEWVHRFSFAWQLAYTAWPIDGNRFTFRQRRVCRRFVYVHGSGGARADQGSSQEVLHRKGLASLLDAARLCPQIPFTVYASHAELPPLTSNIECRPRPMDNRLLYGDGDVCVQPSHWEGLGLPLLECQAAGMPLLTTDAAPMNEHNPWRVIPAQMQLVQVSEEFHIPAAMIDPQEFARVLRSAYGRGIYWRSRQARRFILRQHSWPAAVPQLMASIRQAIAERHKQRSAETAEITAVNDSE